jgi:hypothetical protein
MCTQFIALTGIILLLPYLSELNGNHCFSPNTDTKTIEQYFNSLEDILNPCSFRVFILRGVNLSGYDWCTSIHQACSHYYTTATGGIIHNAAFYSRLLQYNYIATNSNLLNFVFAHLIVIHVSKSRTDLATPVNCHPSWHNGLGLLFETFQQVPILFRNYACGDFPVLFEMLSPHNSFVCTISPILIQVVTDALNQTVLYTYIKSLAF